MMVGDSLAGGFYVTRPEVAFRSLVEKAMAPVLDLPATVGPPAPTRAASVTTVPADLDLAVVELGTNDVDRTPPERFALEYDGVLNRVRQTSPDAVLVCVGTWSDHGERHDAVIESSCRRAGGRFVPVDGLFDDPALSGPAGAPSFIGPSDDWHPNDAGHRAIAAAVLGVLTIR